MVTFSLVAVVLVLDPHPADGAELEVGVGGVELVEGSEEPRELGPHELQVEQPRVDLEGHRISGGIGLAFTAGTTLDAGATALAVNFDPVVDTATATALRDNSSTISQNRGCRVGSPPVKAMRVTPIEMTDSISLSHNAEDISCRWTKSS